MVFPHTGLPNRVVIEESVQTDTDANDNPVFTPVPVLDRPARYYRDGAREMVGATDSVVVEGMVAFPAEPTDTLDLIPIDAEILVKRGQFSETGSRYRVVNPVLQMLWKRPSHWEISIGRTR